MSGGEGSVGGEVMRNSAARWSACCSDNEGPLERGDEDESTESMLLFLPVVGVAGTVSCNHCSSSAVGVWGEMALWKMLLGELRRGDCRREGGIGMCIDFW